MSRSKWSGPINGCSHKATKCLNPEPPCLSSMPTLTPQRISKVIVYTVHGVFGIFLERNLDAKLAGGPSKIVFVWRCVSPWILEAVGPSNQFMQVSKKSGARTCMVLQDIGCENLVFTQSGLGVKDHRKSNLVFWM